jgi:uncharacterized protein YycO
LPPAAKYKPNPMTKNTIIILLAVVSLALSYFYEVTPAKSAELTSSPTNYYPITPHVMHSGEDIGNVLMAKHPVVTIAPVVKAEEEFYSKKLGIRFKDSANKKLVETVTKWLGTPYRYGSSSKKGTDCSGFVTRIYQDVYGIDLSRSSRSMFGDVQRVKKDSVQTGDLIFFKRGPKQPIYHVGIYLKNGKFIHSASNGGVRVSSLKESYYRNNYYAAGRVI